MWDHREMQHPSGETLLWNDNTHIENNAKRFNEKLVKYSTVHQATEHRYWEDKIEKLIDWSSYRVSLSSPGPT